MALFSARQPTIEFDLSIFRSSQTVVDQLVSGLVGGGLMGPGLAIDRRDADLIRFRRVTPLWFSLPDKGELIFSSETSSGATAIRCRLWCRGVALRALVIGLLLGLFFAGQLASLWGWQIASAGGPLAAVITAATTYRLDQAQLVRQVRSYVENTKFLKTF